MNLSKTETSQGLDEASERRLKRKRSSKKKTEDWRMIKEMNDRDKFKRDLEDVINDNS